MPDKVVDHRLRGADHREQARQERTVEFILGEVAVVSRPHRVQQRS